MSEFDDRISNSERLFLGLPMIVKVIRCCGPQKKHCRRCMPRRRIMLLIRTDSRYLESEGRYILRSLNEKNSNEYLVYAVEILP